jgi:RNA polymerase sigma factor (TIGR02999 family)
MATEAADHSLQPTALVHEAYLRLVGAEPAQGWAGRGHFFAAAAEAMRRLLVDHVRRKRSRRRGGARGCHPLSDEDLVALPLTDELVDLDDALAKLRATDPAAAGLVTMRVFGGMTVEEIAAAQGTSARTVKRDWAYARAWLGRDLAAYDQRTP